MAELTDHPALDVAIGMILVFLVLALVVSGINELISRALSWRAKFLEEGIRTLLQDPASGGYTQDILDHPLIRGLQRNGSTRQAKKTKRPSYIPSKTFATALLDTIAPPAQGSTSLLDAAAQKVDSLENPELKRALQSLLRDAQGNVEAFRKNVEEWYDASMERVTGWYKRRVHTVVLVLSMAVALGLNADSFQVANTLWTDGGVRAAVVAEADKVAAGEDPTTDPDFDAAAERVRDIAALKLPLGWSDVEGDPRKPPEFWSLEMLWKLLGIALTGLAISLGAPFWFDALGKAARLRTAGEKPAKAGGDPGG